MERERKGKGRGGEGRRKGGSEGEIFLLSVQFLSQERFFSASSIFIAFIRRTSCLSKVISVSRTIFSFSDTRSLSPLHSSEFSTYTQIREQNICIPFM